MPTKRDVRSGQVQPLSSQLDRGLWRQAVQSFASARGIDYEVAHRILGEPRDVVQTERPSYRESADRPESFAWEE